MNVYLFHDHFPGTSLDGRKWTLIGGTATVAGSILTVNANGRVFANAAYAFGANTRWEARIALSVSAASDFNYLTATTQSDFTGNDWVAFWSKAANHFVENGVGGGHEYQYLHAKHPDSLSCVRHQSGRNSGVRYFQDAT